MPGRACCGCAAALAATGSGRGPPSIVPGGARPRRRTDIRVGQAAAGPALACPAVPDAGAVPGVRPAAAALPAGCWTMRGCVTGGRLAGANGRAGCGVWPGCSMRSRSVGGTKRPDGGDRRAAVVLRPLGAATSTGVSAAAAIGSSSATGAATGAGGASIYFSRARAPRRSGTIGSGSASSTITGGSSISDAESAATGVGVTGTVATLLLTGGVSRMRVFVRVPPV